MLRPWWGMEASITRGFPGKPEKGKMGPQHALSLEEGKFADMIIFNQNLFEIPATDRHKTEVLNTLFKGQTMYTIQ
ncbi:amidohydrolase family protein [Pseudomonadota bacterium]